MDLPTLLICTVLACCLMIMSTSAMYKLNKDEQYLRDWIFVGVFFLFSNLLAICANSFQLSSPIFPALGNAFYLAGHASLYSGVSLLVNKKSKWPIVLLISVLTIIAHSIPALSESVTTRILVFYPIIAVLDIAALVLLLSSRASEESKSYWPLILLLFLFVMQLLVRGFFLLTDDAELTLLGNQFEQTFGHLIVIGFIFLLTICFSIVVSWKKEIKLRKASVTDYLTGLFNREGLDNLASRIFTRDVQGNTTSGFILVDIDHFKSFNDNFGHAMGDSVIQAVTEQMSTQLRVHDYGFRVGGEEFAVLISNTTTPELMHIAERIRIAVEQCKVRSLAEGIKVTISAGVALRERSEISWQQTLNRADKALYEAKTSGRNKAVLAKNIEPDVNVAGDIAPNHCEV